MKAIFCTLATGDYLEYGGTPNLLKSAKRFHPDIPFEVISEAPADMGYCHAVIGAKLADDYDLVIYIDCDSIITAPLTEVFTQDYEVAGVRNNSDTGRLGCPHCWLAGVPNTSYVNGGFTACRNKAFWQDWHQLNQTVKHQMWEQHTLNLLFHSNKYKAVILDPPEARHYYGIASTYGRDGNPWPWQSWERMKIEDDHITLDGKVIKIIHEAGGHPCPKMLIDGGKLPKPVAEWIKRTILHME